MTHTDQDVMSTAEKIIQVQKLWDEIADDAGAVPLTEAQREILEQRLGEHRRTPDDAVPWSQVREAILKGHPRH